MSPKYEIGFGRGGMGELATPASVWKGWRCAIFALDGSDRADLAEPNVSMRSSTGTMLLISLVDYGASPEGLGAVASAAPPVLVNGLKLHGGNQAIVHL